MATYEQRGRRVRVKVMRHGERVSKTFDNKREAQAWASDFTSGHEGGNRTLDEALSRYKRDVTPTKRGSRWEEIRIDKLRREIKFVHRRLADIAPDDFGKWRDVALKGSDDRKALKPASVARELALLGSVLETARKEWGWTARNVVKDVTKPKGAKPRKRVILEAETDVLIAALGYTGGRPETASQRVAVAFLLALETAMRAGEICALVPEHIHLGDRYVHLPETKNGSERDVPLTVEAVRLLKLVPKGFDLDPPLLDALFRKARDRAAVNHPELASIHFHDTRRTATVRLSKKLQPMELAKVTGHKDLKTLLNTYYQVRMSELTDKLDG